MKLHYFQGDDGCHFEPMCGTAGIANGTEHSIGHLVAASICHGGPGTSFLGPWICKCIAGGSKELLKDLHKELSLGLLYCEISKEVILF